MLSILYDIIDIGCSSITDTSSTSVSIILTLFYLFYCFRSRGDGSGSGEGTAAVVCGPNGRLGVKAGDDQCGGAHPRHGGPVSIPCFFDF